MSTRLTLYDRFGQRRWTAHLKELFLQHDYDCINTDEIGWRVEDACEPVDDVLTLSGSVRHCSEMVARMKEELAVNINVVKVTSFHCSRVILSKFSLKT